MWKKDRERAIYPVTIFVSLVAYAVASMTHPRAWFDFYYMLLMYSAAWSGLVQRQVKSAQDPMVAAAAPAEIEWKIPQHYAPVAQAPFQQGVTRKEEVILSLYRNLVRHDRDLFGCSRNLAHREFSRCCRVYTAFLTTTAYGLLEVLEVVTYVFGALVGINLGSALAYFYAKADTEEDRLATIHTATLGAHMIGAAAIAVGWFVSPLLSRLLFQTPDYTIHCRVTFINFSLAFAQEMGLALLRVQNRSALYVRILTARLVVLIGINVTLLAVFHLGALAMLLGTTISSLLVTLYLDARNLLGVRWHFQFRLLKQQLKYAYPLGLSAVGMTFIHSGDRFFLQRFASLSEVGLYGIAYKFGTLAGYIQPTFETYWNAQVFHVMKQESGERDYVRTMTYFALVSAAAAVVVGLFSQPLVRVMTPKAYQEAMTLSPLIAACYAWRGVGDYFRNAFALHRKTWEERGRDPLRRAAGGAHVFGPDSSLQTVGSGHRHGHYLRGNEHRFVSRSAKGTPLRLRMAPPQADCDLLAAGDAPRSVAGSHSRHLPVPGRRSPDPHVPAAAVARRLL